MNYEPNTTHWKIGDIVIHDADHKDLSMLMIVVGYTRDGLCKTQYYPALKTKPTKKIYINEIRYLHDPRRFHIPVPTIIENGVRS